MLCYAIQKAFAFATGAMEPTCIDINNDVNDVAVEIKTFHREVSRVCQK
jgi:hypothetical protein